eukprot:6144665-Pyramimonas_sp.AAC.1
MAISLDASHQCWMQVGPAKAFYSDGEGALKGDVAKAAPMAKSAELWARARGQRAATREARNGRLRHLLRVVEAELKRLDAPHVFTRLLHDALFVAAAFPFYNEASPCNA